MKKEIPLLREIECMLMEFFHDDARKVTLWFQGSNPLLGGMSPQEWVNLGKIKRLHKFVKDLLEENKR